MAEQIQGAGMDGFKMSKLENGVRVLTESVGHVGSASIGVWCVTGSKDETETEAGITHFIEHMLFKGTPSRNSQQIAEAIEGRGGMLNAFTDKERTCYYCRVLAEDAGHGLGVLSDMVNNSLLDPEELEREKGVVLEEIKRSEDEPGDHVHDLHLQGLWEGHKLGLPIIGTAESVKSFGQSDLRSYMDRRYRGDTIVIAAAGNIDHQEFVDCVEENYGGLTPGKKDEPLEKPAGHPGDNLVAKDIEQVHFCIGADGVSHHDEDFYTMVVLDGVLGGGMSSRLFQEIREKRGLAYAVGSYHMTYSVGGAFTVYGGTGLQTWEQVQELVAAELKKISTEGPTGEEMAKVKRQIAGNLVLGLEGMSSRMMRMAKNEMVFGRQLPMEETVAKINAVTKLDVTELAARTFDPTKMRTTAIGPF